MRFVTKALTLALLLMPLALFAAPVATAKSEEGTAGREAWGQSLPETLLISMWSSREGEVKAAKISTSREVFGLSFEMGAGDKQGIKIAVAGRILPKGNGSYELLLYVDGAGASGSKGAMGIKVQSSVIAKKGAPAVVAGNQDGQLMIRID